MRLPSPIMIVFWACMIVIPFVITAVALAMLPPDIVEIPMQVGFDGKVNRTAPPSELWLLSAIMAFCNALMALCYCANDYLFALGLVNGVKKKSSALKVYVICAVFLVIVQAFCTAFLFSLA